MTLPGEQVSLKLPRLLWRNAWRYHCQHYWQSLLSMLGIMLGVMMVVAVDLASSSASRAFDLSVESVSGNITHQIVGGSAGVPDAVFTGLRTELGLRRSAPVVSSEVISQQQSLTLLGLDLISEAALQRRLPGLGDDTLALTMLGAAALRQDNAVIMSQDVADLLGLQAQDQFRLNRPDNALSLTLAATLPPGAAQDSARMIFTDIAVAQRLLGKSGRLDSIDLVLSDEEAVQVQDWLPPGVSLVEASGRNASLEQMTEAFHVNLLAMSLLALLVAALLIYNTVTLSVLERRAAFGVLRSLGICRGELTRLVLAENAVMGLVAGVFGVLAGIWLGSFLVQLVTRTIDDLYFNLTVQQFNINPWLLLKGFGWGLALTLLAAALPAWQAGQSPPVTLQQKGQGGLTLQRRLPWYSLSGLIMMLAGLLVLQSGSSLTDGFISLFLLVFGFCLLVPQILHLLLRGLLLLPVVRYRFGLRLALRNIESGLDRTALAVAALTVAVSVTVGVGIMVGSLRDTVLLWLDQTLPGDIQVTSVSAEARLPQALRLQLENRDDIRSLSRAYLLETESSVGPLRVQSDSADPAEWLFVREGSFRSDNGIMIAEPLASLYQLGQGDSLEILTARGERSFTVDGIFYDYTTGEPVIAMPHAMLLDNWPETPPRRFTLKLADGTDIDALVTELQTLLRQNQINAVAVANSSIHARTFDIFDRTFAITYVLRLQAIMVAFVGVFSALLALQLQRLRDYAILRASGMTIAEVSRLIMRQTVVMGALAGLLSLPMGLMMSGVLIDVINMRSFGWSMQHSLPMSVLGEAILLAVIAAALAGIYPASRVARVQAADALRGE